MSQTIFYARVSTADQTLDHQKTQAEKAGFKIDSVVADHGVSGISTKLSERQRATGSTTCSAQGTPWWFAG